MLLILQNIFDVRKLFASHGMHEEHILNKAFPVNYKII